MSRPTQIATAFSRPIVVVLLLVYGTLAWTSVRDKSTTYDEIAHLTAGYSYWLTGDYRLHPENGVLPQRWAALPLLMQNVRFPERDERAWWHSDVWTLGPVFFYRLGNNLDSMLWRSRGMIVLLGVALGAVIYTWSRRLFGPLGGIISLTIYTFSPTCLAHGRLITSDMAVTLAFTVSLACMWKAMHRISVATVLASSVAMGLLFVAKMSAVLILPVALLLLGIRVLVGRPLIVAWRHEHVVRRRWRQLAILAGITAIHAIVVVAVIWQCYGFRYSMFCDAEPNRDMAYGGTTVNSLTDAGLLGATVCWANDHQLLPEAYLHGFAYAVNRSKMRSAFFNGEYSKYGWRSFFPYCLLVKTPLAIFAVLVAAGLAVAAARRPKGQRSARGRPSPLRNQIVRGLYRTLPIWLFLLVYWLVAITSHLNIGHRHILPTYPLMFILCGAAAYWLDRPQRIVAVLIVLALVELAVESLIIYPHYLAYFNQLVGGPRHGYRHLVDSSLDWGQDLPGLKRWLEESQPAAIRKKPIYLAYFGMGSPEYYDLDVTMLANDPAFGRPGFVPLLAGTYSISATMLQGVYIAPYGPWDAEAENNYQILRDAVDAFAAKYQADPEALQQWLNDPDSTEERAEWNRIISSFDELRFGRLCAYLRTREPDDSIGYSILIYYLSEQDVEKALN